MEAVEALNDPFQRTALLLLRWSGARRGEIARLTLDCLDAYPDGYPRLRIPVGKTYAERMIPLHQQAADALRGLIEHRKAAPAAAHHDRWAGRHVHWVFVHRGQPIGRRCLFEDALETACTRAGLVDANGKPTVTAHRFRHTVGAQLAEGGARIQTIMAILGLRSAGMAVTYSHISDPVLKAQYERVIANGGRVAGPAAEALLNNQIGQETLDWLKSNYFKTELELELGHCLRLPAEGPCECDLYLRCSKFFTTSEYAKRLSPRSPPTKPSSTNPPPAQPSPKSPQTEHHPDTPNTTDPAGQSTGGVITCPHILTANAAIVLILSAGQQPTRRHQASW